VAPSIDDHDEATRPIMAPGSVIRGTGVLRTGVIAVNLLSTAGVLSSCRACDDRPGSVAREAGALEPDAGGRTRAASSSSALPGAAPSSLAADAAVAENKGEGDAGASACRLVYGPAEQPFRGPAALSMTNKELVLVVNDGGRPAAYPLPITPPPPGKVPPVVPPRPATFAAMRWPGCELAGRFAYCPGPGGAIVRYTSASDRAGWSDPKPIAKGGNGGRITAASIGPDHSVVAFLEQRVTTEGNMLQAFVALDDKEPVRLSDDGAGATVVHFLPRGESAVAVYLDSRTAMVPVHARPVTLRGAELALGTDAVIFVGGAPERGINFAVAAAGPKSFVLLPMPRETTDFGMAAVEVHDPPKEDPSPVWSPYPNGIDPAPLAAAPTRDGKAAWVARVRPRERAPGSPRILELGRVDSAGVFTSFGEIASAKGVSDVGLAEDTSGALWIVYGDTAATWLERRVCAP
jgi:hypothetical protein